MCFLHLCVLLQIISSKCVWPLSFFSFLNFLSFLFISKIVIVVVSFCCFYPTVFLKLIRNYEVVNQILCFGIYSENPLLALEIMQCLQIEYVLETFPWWLLDNQVSKFNNRLHIWFLIILLLRRKKDIYSLFM